MTRICLSKIVSEILYHSIAGTFSFTLNRIMAMLAVVIVTMSTILSVISLPISSDKDSDCYKGHHVIIKLAGNKSRCHLCTIKCPGGMGMSIKCDGQVVLSDVSIHCVDCIPGVNFSSTNDFSQCKPCPVKCENQEIRGQCKKDGDYRECIPCHVGSYYNRTQEKCMPCSCHNLNTTAKKLCHDKGFNFEQCKKPYTEATPAKKNKGGLKAWQIIVIVIVGIAVLVLCIYCCLVGRRLKKFYMDESHWPARVNEWFKKILCSCCSPARQESNNETEQPDGVNVDQTEARSGLERQNSCPVTHDEFERATNRTKRVLPFRNACKYDSIKEADSQEDVALIPRISTVCLKESFKLSEVNAEECHQMYNRLNVTLSTSFVHLAGLMGYTHEQEVQFRSTANPAEKMLDDWSKLEGHNVLKLIELLRKARRDDIANSLKDELEKRSCQCAACVIA